MDLESNESVDLVRGYKEWSGVVAAMGHGLQTVMVRTYRPRFSRFLLYPTFSYSLSPSAPDAFQKSFQHQASLAAKETKRLAHEELLVEIKYFAEVERVKQIEQRKWKELEPFFVWSHQHIEKYLNKTPGRAPGYLWICRVFALPHTLKFGRLSQGGSLAEYKHVEPVETNGSLPILDNKQFETIVERLTTIIESK